MKEETLDVSTRNISNGRGEAFSTNVSAEFDSLARCGQAPEHNANDRSSNIQSAPLLPLTCGPLVCLSRHEMRMSQISYGHDTGFCGHITDSSARLRRTSVHIGALLQGADGERPFFTSESAEQEPVCRKRRERDGITSLSESAWKADGSSPMPMSMAEHCLEHARLARDARLWKASSSLLEEL